MMVCSLLPRSIICHGVSSLPQPLVSRDQFHERVVNENNNIIVPRAAPTDPDRKSFIRRYIVASRRNKYSMIINNNDNN